MDTTGILAALQSASSEVKSAKTDLDNSQAKAREASSRYDLARKKVTDLRKELNKALDDDLNGIVEPSVARGRLSE